MSRDERRRLEELERIARDGRDKGEKATADLAAHTQVCTERHNQINGKLTALFDNAKWQSRGIITLLLGLLGAILMEIAKAKGLF